MARAIAATSRLNGWAPAAAVLASASVLWGWALALAWPQLMLAGQICSQTHQSLFDHCPLCYPAAALTLAGLALAGREVLRRRA